MDMLGLLTQIKTAFSLGVDATNTAKVVCEKATGKTPAAFLEADQKKEHKEIYIVIPPMAKHDCATAFLASMSNKTEFRDFTLVHRGSLVDNTGLKLRFEQLRNEGVYTIFGTDYMAVCNEIRIPKVDNKMQEVNALIAVKKLLEGKRILNFNVSIFGLSTNEVLLHEESPDTSTAYICESAHSPNMNEIEILTDKVIKFQVLAQHHDAFRTVRKVVPVLAGHSWRPETIARAVEGKVWRVHASTAGGGTYQVVRGFATVARRVLARHV